MMKRGLTIRDTRKWSKYVLKSSGGASERRLKRLMVRERGKRERDKSLKLGIPKESDMRIEALLRGYERVKKQRLLPRHGNLSMFEAGLVGKIIADTALKNLQLKKMISVKEYSNLHKATIKLVKASAIIPYKNEHVIEEALKEITRICGGTMGKRITQEIVGMTRIIKDWIVE